MWNWVVKGQQLILQSDTGDSYRPDSVQIMACLAEDFQSSHMPAKDMEHAPYSDIDSLRFSQLEARIEVYVELLNNHSIEISAKAIRGKKHAVITETYSELSDHIILQNTWYHMSNAHASLKNLMNDTGILEFGNITLSQYLALKKYSTQNDMLTIIDNAYEKLSNHSVGEYTTGYSPEIKATLFPYQEIGFRWMQYVTKQNCGCILGDEMGLGKTLQVITLITFRRTAAQSPALVIAPVSLLENWKREINRFSPSMSVLVHHGPHRTGRFQELTNHDVIIISYNTACADQALLKMVTWDILVLDEAQAIKNPQANRTLSVKKIPRFSCVAVTGTPFENHITDIWSLTDFIMPNYFGKLSDFNKSFSDDFEGAKKLEPLITPLILRRNVKEVAKDLPERIDIPQVIQMSESNITKYEDIRSSIIQDLGSGQATLPLLQKLRMYCTHPFVLDSALSGDPAECSQKYERMCEILQETIILGEKVILFTSYNAMFDVLATDIPKRFGIPVMSINGSTVPADRQLIVDRFSEIEGPALLVLNPKAAGTGLNITAASRVIHYNLEWNPAIEDQASARSYRRGQQKNVFIYRLFYAGTVEEVINERIEKKRTMFANAIVGVDGSTSNTEDIIRALHMSPLGGRR